MTEAQFLEGLAYAEDNFQNENAPHLHVDKKLIREHFDLNGKKVLDFGCGMGGMSLWYASNWDCEVYALDIDGHHINVAKSLQKKHNATNVTFEKRDVLERPLTEQYDLVFLNDVAEHIPLEILGKILKQLAFSLKKGGSIFVTYPPWRSPYASHLNHVIKTPWIQFFPQSYVEKLIDEHNHPLVGDLESDLREAYHGLNKLTHEKIFKLAQEAGLQKAYRKSHSIINRVGGPFKNINLRVFPLDFLVTKEFLELKNK